MENWFLQLRKSASAVLKHDARFPQLAIDACLQFANVRVDELDEICFGWQTAGGPLPARLEDVCDPGDGR